MNESNQINIGEADFSPPIMGKIIIRGAREHNLKNVSVEIPQNAITVITGVSGSGKSTLAFDTIFAEGRRRYLESLPAAARQYLNNLSRPDVDSVDGLAPAIAIEQNSVQPTARATLATITELSDYFEVLFAKLGEVHCPNCGQLLKSTSPELVVEELLSKPEGTRLTILTPLLKDGSKGAIEEALRYAELMGFVRVRINGEIIELEEASDYISKTEAATIEAVVDRIVVREGARHRVTDSVELAMRIGKGTMRCICAPKGEEEQELCYSEHNKCFNCDYPGFELLTAKAFSSNSAIGACPQCHGLGKCIQNGKKQEPITSAKQVEGATLVTCSACKGTRFSPQILACTLPHPSGSKNIAEVYALQIDELKGWLQGLNLTMEQAQLVAPVFEGIFSRVDLLCQLRVGYLTLAREGRTLSRGELQRIRLASHLGGNLTGVLYVLDEPTIGLHSSDTQLLAELLRQLQKQGNTVVVVEHDPIIIRAADYVVDLGPGAGVEGGEILAVGTPKEIEANPASITGAFLSGREKPLIPPKVEQNFGSIKVYGAQKYCLPKLNAKFPLGKFTVVTGRSGVGKSTLVNEVLCENVATYLANRGTLPNGYIDCDCIDGLDQIDKLIAIDATPFGRSDRSNLLTYMGVFGIIRDLFAATPAAKARGYTATRFSFNVKGGRCEVCKGTGVKELEMSFLPDVTITCEQCGGTRYNRETLEVHYAGRSIAQVLDLTVAEAISVFDAIPQIRSKLELLAEVGLGYLKLGQAGATLSGGEAQRLKLAAELSRPADKRTLYVLDEPTIGLHFADVRRLVECFMKLRNKGHTIIVIEHNDDVIAAADCCIELLNS